MTAWAISILRIVIVTIGIFMGFYKLPDTTAALEIVAFTTVGIVGILSFASHFIFYKSDAKRLGWETDRPDWQFEVGFANLAFGLVALIAYFGNWGPASLAAMVLAYALYMLMAAILHGYRFFTGENKSIRHLVLSVLLTILYSGMMIYFAIGGVG